MTADGHQGPLVGLIVVELAHIMAGPVCGLMLAEFRYDEGEIADLAAQGAVVAAPASGRTKV